LYFKPATYCQISLKVILGIRDNCLRILREKGSLNPPSHPPNRASTILRMPDLAQHFLYFKKMLNLVPRGLAFSGQLQES